MAAAAMGDPALASATPAQRAAAAAYGPTGVAVPCVPGQPCPQAQQGNMQMQLTPEQQQAQLLAAKERERADNSRFASNLVYSRSAEPPQQQQQGQTMPAQYGPAERQTNSNLVAPAAEGKQEDTPGGYKRPLEANIDSAVGQPYVIYEGSVLDTVLMNRLDGDAVGPVKVLVSNPVYSHDHQHVLIPEGTVVLGEAKKIGAAGFGQQRRMAVVFHRMIMPDGYSVDLDQFHGLDQIGEEGLKDKVNNHYLQIFGTSIALGVIAGAGQITQGGGTITTSGSQAFTTGAAAAFRSLRRLSLIASFRYRPRSRFAKAIASRSTSRRTCFFLRTTTTLFRRRFEEPICAQSSLPLHCSPLCSSSVARSRLPVTRPIRRRCAKHSSSVFGRIHRLRSAGRESRC